MFSLSWLLNVPCLVICYRLKLCCLHQLFQLTILLFYLSEWPHPASCPHFTPQYFPNMSYSIMLKCLWTWAWIYLICIFLIFFLKTALSLIQSNFFVTFTNYCIVIIDNICLHSLDYASQECFKFIFICLCIPKYSIMFEWL